MRRAGRRFRDAQQAAFGQGRGRSGQQDHQPQDQAGAAHGLSQELARVPGVLEATVVAEEGVAYVKIDRSRLDEERLARYGASS